MYSDSREYLLDELNQLDRIIHLHILKQQQVRSVDPLQQFRGLVLSEEEIVGLLGDVSVLPKNNESCKLREMKIEQIRESLRAEALRIRERREASLNNGIYLSLNHLAQIFNLTHFEQQCIIICLAVELERKYGKLYAYLQNDVTRQKPDVELILKLLCPVPQERLEARSVFSPQAPLIKHGLLQLADNSPGDLIPLISRNLKLNDRIVDFLLEFGQIDVRLAPVASLVLPGADKSGKFQGLETRQRVKEFLYSYFGESGSVGEGVVFYCHGKYGAGKKLLVESLCDEFELPLIYGDTERMLDSWIPFGELMQLLGREAALQGAILCLVNFDHLLDRGDKSLLQLESMIEAVQTYSRLTFLLGRRPWNPQGVLKGTVFIDIEAPAPDVTARQNLWEELSEEYLGADTPAFNPDWRELAGKFRFTPGQIRDALAVAHHRALWCPAGDRQVTMADLYAACQAQSNQKLSSLAQKLKPGYTWDDIILPLDRLKQLQEICSQVKYRDVVFDQWGFAGKMSYGRGLNALFSGPPGTGKTMSAEVIAGELQMDLYKIDLSQVISKYIGETEQNLQRIFDEAATSNAILFFDEADALFGKRSEVRDAHDRYANIETAYLLQKIEEYDGITILATNLRNNMDDAFVRRMRFIVDFPFPDEVHREKIWRHMFPEDTPRNEDLDLKFLAKKFRIAGGDIKNIVLAAAFLAAGETVAIGMEHLIRATRDEMHKNGKLCLKEDFGEYYEWIN
ncbi:ATP-binding protein [Desulfosporosinus sp. BG]|uniref:ATP-binding protein n=1 Tax=Desulfosporosinus sp. BG TaxID=1633135 RepID=UPI000855C2DA|nr:ATP-binding protein [Desulfosporosinus sp. BG]ODA40657.1 ATPase, AAA family [Desulfosporosinus sp. BG]